MSLYRRGRIWWIKFKRRGRPIRRSSGSAVRARAQELEDKLKAQRWRIDALGEAPPIAWEEAVRRWMRAKPRGLHDRYRLASLEIDPQLDAPLDKDYVEARLEAAAERWRERVAEHGGSPGGSAGSWNRSRALIVAIHNEAGLRPPDVKRRKMPPGRTRWLTAEDWKRLRTALERTSPLLRQAAEFTLATGLRENNVLGLTWDQVDLKRRVAWLHPDQVKTAAAIGVPLNDAALAILEERRGMHRRIVFGNPDYVLYKASNRAWYDAIKAARLGGFRWHDLRHTWASWAVMSGVRLEELQRLGGWKTAQMVQRYAHLSPEHLAEAAAKVAPVSLRRGTKRGTMGG